MFVQCNDNTTKTPNPVLHTFTTRVTYQHLENDLVTCVYRKIRCYDDLKKKTVGEKVFADWAVAKRFVGQPIYRCCYKDGAKRNVEETFGDQEEMESMLEAVQAENWGKLPTALELIVQMS